MGNEFDDFDEVPKPQLVFGGKKEEAKEEIIKLINLYISVLDI